MNTYEDTWILILSATYVIALSLCAWVYAGGMPA